MQTITTTIHGPTDKHGTRISARIEASTTVGPYDSALSSEENHAAAARALADKMEWSGELVGGSTTQRRMVWVFVDGSPRA